MKPQPALPPNGRTTENGRPQTRSNIHSKSSKKMVFVEQTLVLPSATLTISAGSSELVVENPFERAELENRRIESRVEEERTKLKLFRQRVQQRIRAYTACSSSTASERSRLTPTTLAHTRKTKNPASPATGTARTTVSTASVECKRVSSKISSSQEKRISDNKKARVVTTSLSSAMTTLSLLCCEESEKVKMLAALQHNGALNKKSREMCRNGENNKILSHRNIVTQNKSSYQFTSDQAVAINELSMRQQTKSNTSNANKRDRRREADESSSLFEMSQADLPPPPPPPNASSSICEIDTAKRRNRNEPPKSVKGPRRRGVNAADASEADVACYQSINATPRDAAHIDRYINHLKGLLSAQISNRKYSIPPLCQCNSSANDAPKCTDILQFDWNWCANNCIYYNNPKEYARILLCLINADTNNTNNSATNSN